MKKTNYIPTEATILKNEVLCDGVHLLTIELKTKKPFHFLPGQFVMMSVFGFGEVPLGISGNPDQNVIEVGVRSAGMVTKKICQLEKGASVGISGPLGNGFPLKKISGKDVVIIAGGIGIFPLRALINHISQKPEGVRSLKILMGAKCSDSLLFKKEHRDWAQFADVSPVVEVGRKGWDGDIGLITDLYSKIKPGSIVIACGPPIIYKTITEKIGKLKVAEEDVYLLLERKMHCGVGKCQHCTCGELYVCLDGPTFSLETLKNFGEGIYE